MLSTRSTVLEFTCRPPAYQPIPGVQAIRYPDFEGNGRRKRALHHRMWDQLTFRELTASVSAVDTEDLLFKGGAGGMP